MSNFSEFIEQILLTASDTARSYYGKVSGTVKPEDNNQVLTEADIVIGDYIVAQIQAQYPDHNIIDEEAGVIDNSSPYTWVVDPIDGTSNFANGLPMYGIMIGLLHNDQPIAGGIALPFFREIYIASKGEGAFCNGELISVSSETKLQNSLVAYEIDGHQEDPQLTYEETRVLAEVILSIRNLRTTNSAFDIAQIARGTLGVLLNKTTKIWDNVAPQIIIEEAGGLYTDYFGNAMDYKAALTRTEENFTMCAGAPTLHAQLQKITQRAT